MRFLLVRTITLLLVIALVCRYSFSIDFHFSGCYSDVGGNDFEFLQAVQISNEDLIVLGNNGNSTLLLRYSSLDVSSCWSNTYPETYSSSLTYSYSKQVISSVLSSRISTECWIVFLDPMTGNELSEGVISRLENHTLSDLSISNLNTSYFIFGTSTDRCSNESSLYYSEYTFDETKNEMNLSWTYTNHNNTNYRNFTSIKASHQSIDFEDHFILSVGENKINPDILVSKYDATDPTNNENNEMFILHADPSFIDDLEPFSITPVRSEEEVVIIAGSVKLSSNSHPSLLLLKMNLLDGEIHWIVTIDDHHASQGIECQYFSEESMICSIVLSTTPEEQDELIILELRLDDGEIITSRTLNFEPWNRTLTISRLLILEDFETSHYLLLGSLSSTTKRCGLFTFLDSEGETCNSTISSVPSLIHIESYFSITHLPFFSHPPTTKTFDDDDIIESTSIISIFEPEEKESLISFFDQQGEGEIIFCYGCYGVRMDNNSTCSSHGICVSVDNCTCEESYNLYDNCESYTCFNTSISDDNNICLQGHGECLRPDVCSCYEGYVSSIPNGLCDEWMCFEIPNYVSKAVCSGQGECVDVDKCICDDEDIVGRECESFMCGEYRQDDEDDKVCSGNGICVDINTCECDSNYFGEDCESNIFVLSVIAPIMAILSTFGGVLVFFIVFVGIFVIIGICFCGCSCIVTIVGLLVFAYRQKIRLNKFGRLKNIDLLIEQQEMEEKADEKKSAKILINKSLFEINMKEIKIVGTLGEGGSNSTVFLGVWHRTKVAFKCFRTKMICQSQNTFNEFEKEVNVLSSISHKYIIRFYGCSLLPPRVGIIMEYCENGDLHDFIQGYPSEENNHSKYPFLEKYRVIEEQIAALEYLHTRNIIHRDIKLENTLLDEMETSKLMDFGLSRYVERMSEVKKTTKIGTNYYVSPEVTLGKFYDEKADVFSFAVFIYILLTERVNPYYIDNSKIIFNNNNNNQQDSEDSEEEEVDPTTVQLRVANNEDFRPRIADLQASLPFHFRWICDVVVTCWDHIPEKRYSFEELSGVFQQNKSEILERAINRSGRSTTHNSTTTPPRKNNSTGRYDSTQSNMSQMSDVEMMLVTSDPQELLEVEELRKTLIDVEREEEGLLERIRELERICKENGLLELEDEKEDEEELSSSEEGTEEEDDSNSGEESGSTGTDED